MSGRLKFDLHGVGRALPVLFGAVLIAAGGLSAALEVATSAPASAQVTVPSAPQDVSGTPGNGSVIASWSAPASNGGSPITGYTDCATPTGGGTPVCDNLGASATSDTISGLTNGDNYFVWVYATNASGTGVPAGTSNENPVTPTTSTTPPEPQDVTATPGNESVTLNWLPPADSTGGPITGYDACATLSPTTVCSSVGPSTTSATVSGLTNGKPYDVYVYATNANGNGASQYAMNGEVSTPTTSASDVPSAPQDMVVTTGNQTITVTWQAPASNGGSAITGYNTCYIPAQRPGGGCFAPSSTATSQTMNVGTNETSYDVYMFAKNANGDGTLAWWSSNPVIASTAPNAPADVTATAGDGTIAVSWQAPESNGSVITTYTDCATPTGGGTPVCDNPGASANDSDTISGLTNGTAYDVAVYATNADGNGHSTSASNNPLTPVGVPTAPQDVSGTPGNGSIAVTWEAPASDGGSPITGYTDCATPTVGGTPVCDNPGASATSDTISGLTNGTAYDVAVYATNTDGNSLSTSASNNPLTPVSVPTAPQDVSGTPGNGSIAVTWEAPASDGGSPITGYTDCATPTVGGTPVCDNPGASATSDTISGLTNGTAYDVADYATNTDGNSLSTSASNNPLTPSTVPTAPQDVSGTPGNGSIAVTWEAPASDGGSPITGYTDCATPTVGGTPVCDNPGASATSDTISGLTNGTAYDVADYATNTDGNSLSTSASNNPLTPSTVPTAPQDVSGTPGNGSIAVTWEAPASDGGSPISGYTDCATPTVGGTPVCDNPGASATSDTISGLTNGTAYDLAVYATNANGNSLSTSASNNPLTPVGVPTAPQDVSGTPGNGSVIASWSASTSDGGSPITGYTDCATPTGGGTPVCDNPGASATSDTISGLTNGTAYDLAVYATNANGNSLSTSASNNPIAATAEAPLFTSAASNTVKKHSHKVNFILKAKGTAKHSPVVTISAGTGLPSWLSVSTFTRAKKDVYKLTGRVPANAAGAYTFTLVATNSAGEAIQSFTLHVT